MQRVFEAVFDFALVFRVLHINEVDHDQATQVTQAQLTGDFFGSFQIGVECGGLDVTATGSARRVNVNRYQCFSVVDHDCAAGWQWHGTRVRGLDLMFDLETREQRHVITISLHTMHHVWHDVAHELLSLFVNVVGVDQNFADIRLEVITNRADNQRRFLIDQEGAAC